MTRTAIFHLCCSLWMLMVPATNALHPRRSTSKLVVILAAAANNNVPRKDTVFGNRPLGKNVLLDNKNSNKNNNCFALGAPNELLLGLRGGGGMGSAILQGMIRNPILVLCKYNNNKPKRRRKNILCFTSVLLRTNDIDSLIYYITFFSCSNDRLLGPFRLPK